jgi:hypothetical protein
VRTWNFTWQKCLRGLFRLHDAEMYQDLAKFNWQQLFRLYISP